MKKNGKCIHRFVYACEIFSGLMVSSDPSVQFELSKFTERRENMIRKLKRFHVKACTLRYLLFFRNIETV